MPHTNEVSWWNRITNAVNNGQGTVDSGPLTDFGASQGTVDSGERVAVGSVIASNPAHPVPVDSETVEGWQTIPKAKDSYQNSAPCNGPLLDCLAQRFRSSNIGSSMWLPLAALAGGLRLIDARQRRMTEEDAARQVKLGEQTEAARMMGAAAETFHELDDAYSEAVAKERQGDIFKSAGYGGFIANAQEAYDHTAAIYARLIKQTSGIKEYRDIALTLKLRRAEVLEKAGLFIEAAAVYGDLAREFSDQGMMTTIVRRQGEALVKAGRYSEAAKIFEWCKSVSGSGTFGNLLDGTRRMAVADIRAGEAARIQPKLETASAAFVKWERAMQIFDEAAIDYRRGGAYELEAMALHRGYEAVRMQAATYNGGNIDFLSMQTSRLWKEAVALRSAGRFEDAVKVLDEEVGLLEQKKGKKGLLAEVRGLRKMVIREARKSADKAAIDIRKMKDSPARMALLIHQLVSPVNPEMFEDASSARSGMVIMAGFVRPASRDVERTIKMVIEGDEGLRGDMEKADVKISTDDWKALGRTAMLLRNVGINALVDSFRQFRVFKRFSLDEKRRFAEAMYGEYVGLSLSERAKWGEPEEGEFLPAKFVDSMAAKIDTVGQTERGKATSSVLGSLEGGRPVTREDLSIKGGAAGGADGGSVIGGNRGGELRDQEAREALKEAGRARRAAGEAARHAERAKKR